MTICIAAICEEGASLILASDTMIMNEALSIQFEHPLRKMTRLSDACIALTAGDALAHTELFDMVESAISKLKAPPVLEIVVTIKECYQRMRETEIRESVLKPRGFDDFGDFYSAQRGLNPDITFAIQNQIDNYDYGLQILVGGITGGAAHIYGISNPGTSKCFDAIGFHAIGSGLPHAINTLIARECHQGRSLGEALLIVYEAKKMAEKAPGVGARITDICVMKDARIKITELRREKLDQLDGVYNKWVTKEPTWANELEALLVELRGWKE